MPVLRLLLNPTVDLVKLFDVLLNPLALFSQPSGNCGDFSLSKFRLASPLSMVSDGVARSVTEPSTGFAVAALAASAAVYCAHFVPAPAVPGVVIFSFSIDLPGLIVQQSLNIMGFINGLLFQRCLEVVDGPFSEQLSDPNAAFCLFNDQTLLLFSQLVGLARGFVVSKALIDKASTDACDSSGTCCFSK